VNASERSAEDSKGLYLTKQEVIADSWIMLFAGHETSANILHYCLLFLAIELEKQAHLQADIDSLVGSRTPENWTYETDLSNIWNSMVGATINETLRLMPPLIDIPKIVRSTPQSLIYDGRKVTVPANTSIHISVVGVHRNPRYWPYNSSKLSSKAHDLDDWVPERWLQLSKPSATKEESITEQQSEGIEENTTTFDTPAGLFVPPKGTFVPFSEGARACPGKRFAQIEITAVLAAIFKFYSLELDVSEWASDEQVAEMGKEEKIKVYRKGIDKARKMIAASSSEIFLKMPSNYPVRFLKRGEERFMKCFT
jgi:cytochrome P450